MIVILDSIVDESNYCAIVLKHEKPIINLPIRKTFRFKPKQFAESSDALLDSLLSALSIPTTLTNKLEAIKEEGWSLGFVMLNGVIMRFNEFDSLIRITSAEGTLDLGFAGIGLREIYEINISASNMLLSTLPEVTLNQSNCQMLHQAASQVANNLRFKGFAGFKVVYENDDIGKDGMTVFTPDSVYDVDIFDKLDVSSYYLKTIASKSVPIKLPHINTARNKIGEKIGDLPSGDLAMISSRKDVFSFARAAAQLARLRQSIEQRGNLDSAVALKGVMQTLYKASARIIDSAAGPIKRNNLASIGSNILYQDVPIDINKRYGVVFKVKNKDETRQLATFASIRRDTLNTADEIASEIGELRSQYAMAIDKVRQAYTTALNNAHDAFVSVIASHKAHELYLQQLQLILDVEIRAFHNNLLLGTLGSFVTWNATSNSYVLNEQKLETVAKDMTRTIKWKKQDCDYWVGLRAGWRDASFIINTDGDRVADDWCTAYTVPYITVANTINTNLNLKLPLEKEQIARLQEYKSCGKTSTVVPAQYTAARPKMLIKNNPLVTHLNNHVRINLEAAKQCASSLAFLKTAYEAVQEAACDLANIESKLLEAEILTNQLKHINNMLAVDARFYQLGLELVDDTCPLTNNIFEVKTITELGISINDTTQDIANLNKDLINTIKFEHAVVENKEISEDGHKAVFKLKWQEQAIELIIQKVNQCYYFQLNSPVLAPIYFNGCQLNGLNISGLNYVLDNYGSDHDKKTAKSLIDLYDSKTTSRLMNNLYGHSPINYLFLLSISNRTTDEIISLIAASESNTNTKYPELAIMLATYKGDKDAVL